MHVCDTWHAMCHHAWPFESLYKGGLKISLCGGGSSFSQWEQEGKEKRKGGKGRRKGGKERKKERRKEKRKGEEERKKKEEEEGVLRSEQTRKAKNPELHYKR